MVRPGRALRRFPQCRLVHVPARQAGRAPEGTGVSPATTVDGAPDTGPPEPQHRRNTHLVPAATWRAQARAPRHSKPWSRPATASPGPDTGVRHKKGNGHVRACRVLLWAGWQLWASHHRICETEGASGFWSCCQSFSGQFPSVGAAAAPHPQLTAASRGLAGTEKQHSVHHVSKVKVKELVSTGVPKFLSFTRRAKTYAGAPLEK